MANDAPVTCGNYLLYPLALHLPHTGKWQAIVVVTHDNGDASISSTDNGSVTLPHSKSFPATPVVFDDEASAKAYALRYGQMLVAGHFKELPT
jgi:hypothetical protein